MKIVVVLLLCCVTVLPIGKSLQFVWGYLTVPPTRSNGGDRELSVLDKSNKDRGCRESHSKAGDLSRDHSRVKSDWYAGTNPTMCLPLPQTNLGQNYNEIHPRQKTPSPDSDSPNHHIALSPKWRTTAENSLIFTCQYGTENIPE
jgi:hypothetical protein